MPSFFLGHFTQLRLCWALEKETRDHVLGTSISTMQIPLGPDLHGSLLFLHLEQCLPKGRYSLGIYLMKTVRQTTILDWTLNSPSCNKLQGMECARCGLPEKPATRSSPLLAYTETAQTPRTVTD